MALYLHGAGTTSPLGQNMGAAALVIDAAAPVEQKMGAAAPLTSIPSACWTEAVRCSAIPGTLVKALQLSSCRVVGGAGTHRSTKF